MTRSSQVYAAAGWQSNSLNTGFKSLTSAHKKIRLKYISFFLAGICNDTEVSESSNDNTDNVDDDDVSNTTTVKPNVHCRTPGELVPNTENCRKYYKCSNGEPSLQSCPGIET